MFFEYFDKLSIKSMVFASNIVVCNMALQDI